MYGYLGTGPEGDREKTEGEENRKWKT